ncbi:DNRLRE domain-containing protein [Longispora albida]|uniref:DNRLRE domain-containing protein n=1 Tax=Longispora albida TaxID=203523 RepID=UPI00038280B6|nr:DNRLRE domain-containing protein [Longispora albida]
MRPFSGLLRRAVALTAATVLGGLALGGSPASAAVQESGKTNWTVVSSLYASTSYYNQGYAGDPAKSAVTGRITTNGTEITRSLFTMDAAPYAGSRIINARFVITQTYTWSCSPTVPVELWNTGLINPGTTWGTQPLWNAKLGSQSPGSSNTSGMCGSPGMSRIVQFDVTGALQQTANAGQASIALGMKAADEGSLAGWRRFDPSTAKLVVEYSRLEAPIQISVNGEGCASGPARPVIADTTATFMALTRTGGTTARLNFSYEKWNGSAFVSQGVTGVDGVAHNTFGQAGIGGLEPGGIYRFFAFSSDSTGFSGLVSLPCEFEA